MLCGTTLLVDSAGMVALVAYTDWFASLPRDLKQGLPHDTAAVVLHREDFIHDACLY